VGLFATPKYGGWDPTPLIAYFFAFFFGLMLGDVIYAVGLFLAARFLLPSFVDDPEADGFKLFQRVIYTSSVVALIVGVVSGIYLGDFGDWFLRGLLGINYDHRPGIVHDYIPLVVGAIRDVIMDPVMFIMVTLGIGLIHINIGHLLGLIKGAQEGNRGAMLSRAGIFVLQVFGIPLILHKMFDFDLLYRMIGLPMGDFISIFVSGTFIGFVMIFIASFMQMKGLGAIFWIFDVTGILGDVMSYSRLAGVALATFYLASAFNMLADMLFGALSGALPGVIGIAIGGIAAIVILVFAHLLNLVLSGMAAFIHSLRLCFVEFLFKFYEGGGRQYEPFCLKPRAFIVVG